jgi:hypothetical protein
MMSRAGRRRQESERALHQAGRKIHNDQDRPLGDGYEFCFGNPFTMERRPLALVDTKGESDDRVVGEVYNRHGLVM